METATGSLAAVGTCLSRHQIEEASTCFYFCFCASHQHMFIPDLPNACCVHLFAIIFFPFLPPAAQSRSLGDKLKVGVAGEAGTCPGNPESSVFLAAQATCLLQLPGTAVTVPAAKTTAPPWLGHRHATHRRVTTPPKGPFDDDQQHRNAEIPVPMALLLSLAPNSTSWTR